MNCPVCENRSFSDFLSGRDYFLTGEEFNIIQCDNCGFLVTFPQPEQEIISRYYESEDYISHDTKDKKLLTLAYRAARFFTVRFKYRIFKKYSPGPRLLDIGCGTGEFLAFCQRKGAKGTGIEPGKKAREFAMEKYQLNIKDRIAFDKDEIGNYDCITLWHVLEHIHDLNGTMSFLRGALKEQGTLILALPNPGSWDARRYKEFWAAYDLPRHLYHFLPEHVENLAKKHGFVLNKILPQKLDAFYISMLSEKNRSGKKDPVKGFLYGLRSNLNASNPAFGYSSHIYILSAKNS